MKSGERIYFLSDFHLGVPDHASSLSREKRIVAFLNEAEKDAAEIHILGDLFDMWFEYREVVPRGFVRLLGKIAEITDRGIPVHLYIGNHDMWIFDYLPKETGVIIHREEVAREWNGQKFLIGHGDGLGPGDSGYKFMKRIFRNRFMQWCFARLHPNLGLGIAHFWSGKSRLKNYANDKKFLGAESEWLAIHCRELLRTQHYDWFIFGHRHLPLNLPVSSGSPTGDPEGESRYLNLGDWISYYTYAVFDGTTLRLMKRMGDGPLSGDVETPGVTA
jgi:UDP-2,3-diacylglucosamine hydrolase